MSLFSGMRGKDKTFRAKKHIPERTHQHRLQKYAEVTLGSGNLKLAVQLPEGEDSQEWLAVHTYDFYNQINMLYGIITEYCTPQRCPVMSAGARVEYRWQDNKQYKKPTTVSAPHYVDLLMNWIQGQLEDNDVFPSQLGAPFPKNFSSIVKTIFKRLFRVYAHIYCHHLEAIQQLNAEPHLNTSFKHFMYFVYEFKLMDKSEMQPLAEKITNVLGDEYVLT